LLHSEKLFQNRSNDGARAFGESVARAFGDARSPFTSGRYRVLTSTGNDQESYRMSANRELTEVSMASVFARSLCEGAGWDLINDRPCPLKADLDGDLTVSFREIFLYTQAPVSHYLEGEDAAQSPPKHSPRTTSCPSSPASPRANNFHGMWG